MFNHNSILIKHKHYLKQQVSSKLELGKHNKEEPENANSKQTQNRFNKHVRLDLDRSLLFMFKEVSL